MHHRPSLLVVLGGCTAMLGIVRTADMPSISAIVTTHHLRGSYLAHATIWRDPGPLSSADVRDGPHGAFPDALERAANGAGIRCTFVTPGIELSGRSAKFLCRADDGQSLRFKYWDPLREAGNREVFATVAATRLMWALGFNAVPGLAMNVLCEDCPESPMTGQGARGARRYLALLQFQLNEPVIVSGHDLDQGWSWRELDDAIAALPPGEERIRQRTHFDALTLLGVLLQHGDRKPEQQAVYCDAPVDSTLGEIRPGPDTDGAMWLLERAPIPACTRAAVVIVDVGATFGGAGRLSRETTSKMNLEQGRKRPVFVHTDTDACRGNLTASIAAGDDGESDPIISEQGRRFLVEQMHRLTTDHVRALFEAARVDQFVDGRRANASAASNPQSVDAWVNAFEDKIHQIESRTCHRAPQ